MASGFRFFKAACGQRRCADANTAGDERGLRVVRDGVFVTGHARFAEDAFGFFTGQAFRLQIDQHDVRFWCDPKRCASHA